MQNNCYPYGETEVHYLSNADPILGQAIASIGKLQREIHPSPYPSLIRSIIAQQISSKAAVTVTNRLDALTGGINPQNVMALSLEEIQKCGMSNRKAQNILNITQAVLDKIIDFERFEQMEDKEVIAALSSLPGIGVWTAEMLMLFTLLRPDILSWGDLAIRRGIMRLYGLEKLSKKEFEVYRALYSPYGSVASLYLWHIAANET